MQHLFKKTPKHKPLHFFLYSNELAGLRGVINHLQESSYFGKMFTSSDSCCYCLLLGDVHVANGFLICIAFRATAKRVRQ